MKDFLSKIDFFGPKVHNVLLRKSNLKTNFGGILSILFLATTVYLSYLLCPEYSIDDKLLYVREKKLSKVSRPYFLKTSKDSFMIKLTDGSLKVYDYATLPFKLSAFYSHFKKDKNGNQNSIFSIDALVPCTQTIQPINPEIAQKIILSEWFCVDWD